MLACNLKFYYGYFFPSYYYSLMLFKSYHLFFVLYCDKKKGLFVWKNKQNQDLRII